MPNIQLPIQTELPAVEPLARAPRGADSPQDSSSFDDHLERASQPADASSSSQRRGENDTQQTPSPEQDDFSETKTASAPEKNGHSDQEATDVADEQAVEKNEENNGHESTKDEDKETEEALATIDEDETNPEIAVAKVIVEQPTEQPKAQEDGTTKTPPVTNETEPIATSKEVVATKPTDADQAQQLNSTATEPVEAVDDTTEVEGETTSTQASAASSGDTADSDENADGKPVSETAVAVEKTPSTASAPTGTDSDDDSTAAATSGSTQEQAEGETDSDADTPRRDDRETVRHDRSSDDAQPATAQTQSQTPGTAEALATEQPSPEAVTTTDIRPEASDAAAPQTTIEGSSEASPSTPDRIDSLTGSNDLMSRLTARVPARMEPATTNDVNLNDPQRVRFVQRVASAFKAAGERDGTVRVRLSPPELGSLRLQVTIKQGVMTAQLETETPEARRVLMENLPELRDRLAQQDMKVERFDINLRDEDQSPSSERSDSDDNAQDGQSGRRSNNTDTANEESEAIQEEPLPTTSADSDQLNIVI